MAKFYEHDGDLLGFVIVEDVLISSHLISSFIIFHCILQIWNKSVV